ncbi:hypothetical protein AKJ65_05010 [candidate division MSBL1 archaeon SCGC-AAA259E19]|uniref:Transposase n=1 Tax=candidate division MSBL1 archaeon SCGC-AAA259E19 TaxID=1698264 RepID=A0A133UJ38_9EURY|nr:hypothetical protein AKJ65_05010 [candidate division MSBL1 archaeon SCGC-AAA259E19]
MNSFEKSDEEKADELNKKPRGIQKKPNQTSARWSNYLKVMKGKLGEKLLMLLERSVGNNLN